MVKPALFTAQIGLFSAWLPPRSGKIRGVLVQPEETMAPVIYGWNEFTDLKIVVVI